MWGIQTIYTQLQLPPLLRKTLLSTNPIESAFAVTGEKTRRVKNGRKSPDQVMRWAATTLVQAEKQFRVIKGYTSLPLLEEALKKFTLDQKKGVA